MKCVKSWRSSVVGCASLLALSCSDGDLTTVLGGEGPAGDVTAPDDGRAQGAPIEATLSLEGNDLAVSLRSHANQDATVRLSVNVDDPSSHHLNEGVGEATVRAGEELRMVLPAAQLQGFDAQGQEWLRTVLRYEFQLDGGRRETRSTELAIREGRALPREQAIEAGFQLPDQLLEIDPPAETPKQATFRVCFTNYVSLRGNVTGTGIDRLREDTQKAVVMPGQLVSYRPPGGSWGNAYLDASGCLPSLARTTGSWTYRIYLYTGIEGPPSSGAYYMSDAGELYFEDRTVLVDSSSTVGPINFRVASAFRPWQAAVFLSNYTMQRAREIGALAPSRGNAVRISPEPDADDAYYCHEGNEEGCTSRRTMRLGSTYRSDRIVVAHETGHWIHLTNLSTKPSLNYDYDNAAGDGCLRGDGHSKSSIEWQPAAHQEGIADFFAAVAFNEFTGAERDCYLLRGGVNTSCESIGLTLAPCLEWTNDALFHVTGNQLDWTKMYWDYFRDRGGNMATYLTAERGITWPDNNENVTDLIFDRLQDVDPNQLNALKASFWGNIWDGPAQ